MALKSLDAYSLDLNMSQRARSVNKVSVCAAEMGEGSSAALPDDLLGVVEAWPQLPEAIRRAVQALAPAGLLGAPCC